MALADLMSDEFVSVPVTLISIGSERPVHMAVDAAQDVPLKPSARTAPGEERPLQVIELEDLHASIDPGSLPGLDAQGPDAPNSLTAIMD